jgi:membrane protease YdiL (CAAX protease family)
VMGALFGVLYEASGTLLAPVLAHALINYENMQYIIHYDPTPLDMDRLR